MTLPILCAPPGDAVSSTLAAPFSHASQSAITVQSGEIARFGSPSATAPIRIRLVKQSQQAGGVWAISDPTQAATYRATGVSGSTLTGLAFESGTAQDFAAGDLVAAMICARDITDIHARFASGPVNVLGSGTVKGDGTTDDGAAIQAIIDAHPGRTIVFPMTASSVTSPSYYSSTTLTLPVAGTRLEGESSGYIQGTIIKFAAGVTGVQVGAGATGCQLKDLILEGSERYDQTYPSQCVVPSGWTGSALADAATSSADGVRVASGLCILTNVVAQCFGRHGFNLSSDQNVASANADCCRLYSCYGLNNRGYGLYVQGGDGNANSFYSFNASVNQLGAVNDQSFLGSFYYGCKTDENHIDYGGGNYSAFPPPAASIASIARSSNVVTLTLSAPYAWAGDGAGTAFVPGQGITVAGVADSTFDGTFLVASASGTAITYAQAAANATSSGGTAILPRMAATWTAAGVSPAGAFITSNNSSTSRTIISGLYCEGNQTPDATGVHGMQLGAGTVLIGGDWGTSPDFTYGTPAIFMAGLYGINQPGFWGCYPSVLFNQDTPTASYEIVGNTSDQVATRYRSSCIGGIGATPLWSEQEGPAYRDLYAGAASGTPVMRVTHATGDVAFGSGLTIPSGATAARPASPSVGSTFLDTTLGKPVWWKGSAWVDATGATV